MNTWSSPPSTTKVVTEAALEKRLQELWLIPVSNARLREICSRLQKGEDPEDCRARLEKTFGSVRTP